MSAEIGGCGSGNDGGSTIVVSGYPPVSKQELGAALAALCDVRAQADTNVESARATFFDRSHTALHVVAGAAARVDRPRAAALLVAKQRVESDLAQPHAPSALGSDVDALIAAAGAAAPRIGVAAPRCA